VGNIEWENNKLPSECQGFPFFDECLCDSEKEQAAEKVGKVEEMEGDDDRTVCFSHLLTGDAVWFEVACVYNVLVKLTNNNE
jgi:hypothetical protein